jgi:cytochrome P450
VGVLPGMMTDPLKTLMRVAGEHPGAIVELPLGPLRVYLVTHPPHVEHVLHTGWRNYGKQSPMWAPIRRLVGKGLATSEGATWVTARRTLQPLFDHRFLAKLATTMLDTITRSADQLAESARTGRSVDMYQEMNVLTQNIILETVFDVEIERSEAERLGAALTTAVVELGKRMFLTFIPQGFPLPGETRLRKALADIDEGLKNLWARWEHRPDMARYSMLRLMREAVDPETGEKLSPQQIRDELITMWTAGNETTAAAMTWIWYLLERNPEVDAKVRAEVAEVLGGRTPTVEDLPRLAYCKRVIQETLRTCGPSWIIPRQSVADQVVDGYFIPGGALVLLSPYVTHHTASLWEEPDRFDPDRFLPERSAGRPPYAFLPFGGGPRRCIGEHFAMMESQLILAMVAQRFRPRMAEARVLEMEAAGALRPKGEARMVIQPA